MTTTNPSKEVFEVTGVQNCSYIVVYQRQFRELSPKSVYMKKINLTAILLIFIPEYGQSNEA